MVPASFILRTLDHQEELKGFFAYGMFFALFMAIGTCRTDWTFGADTQSLLQLAQNNIGMPNFLSRDKFDAHLAYLNTDIDAMTTELAATCANCKVAITDQSLDLASLSMKQFVCTDFSSIEGSNYYPARDCPAADAEYANQPDFNTAPCCINQTLVRASMSAMTWGQPGMAPEFLEPDFLSAGEVSLQDLLDIDIMFEQGPPDFGRPGMTPYQQSVFDRFRSDRPGASIPPGYAHAGTYLYVSRSVEIEGSSLAQLIVARGARMVGHELGVEWVDKFNSPGYVNPSQKVWTWNFEVDEGNNEWDAFKFVLWLFYSISFVHEILVYYARCLTWAEFRGEFFRPYTFFLFLPSTLLPVIMDLYKTIFGTIKVSEFVLIISMMQVHFALRAIQEGKVLEPFTLIVLTVTNASAQLGYVLFVVSIFTGVLICSYGQLFAVVDDSMILESTHTKGLERVFSLLTGPPEISEVQYEQSMLASIFLYFVCVFAMFMTFSSLIIATISDAFSEAVATLKIPAPTPVGYHVRRRGTVSTRNTSSYMICWRVWGTWGPGLYRKLTTLSRSPEGLGITVEDSSGGQDILYTQEELADVFGPVTASELARMYAVEKLPDEITPSSKTDNMLEELLKEVKELKLEQRAMTLLLSNKALLSGQSRSVATSSPGGKALLSPTLSHTVSVSPLPFSPPSLTSRRRHSSRRAAEKDKAASGHRLTRTDPGVREGLDAANQHREQMGPERTDSTR